MRHHSFFENEEYYTEDTSHIVTYLNSIGTYDYVTHKYIEGLSIFLDRYSLKSCQEKEKLVLISYNYWYILFLYEKHKNNKNNWAESTFSKYFLSGLRLLEFSIYILYRKKYTDFFLQLPAEEMILFDHYKNIQPKIKMIHFDISKEDTNKVMVSGLGYKSALKIAPPKNNKEIDFNFYLKLEDTYVNHIYELQESKNMINGRNSSGSSWERVEIQSYDEYQNKLLELHGQTEFTENDEISHESNKERNNRKNKMLSIQLESINDVGLEEMIDIQKLDRVNLNSMYKRYLINKAIGRAISRKNMALKSKYSIPALEILIDFIKLCTREHGLNSNLILLTLVLGIDTKKLIYAMMGFDTEVIFKSRKSALQIKNKNIFAINYDISKTIAMSTSGKFVEIYLPESIVRVWQESKTHIHTKFHMFLLQIIKEHEIDNDYKNSERTIRQFIETSDGRENISKEFGKLVQEMNGVEEKQIDILGIPKDLCEKILEEGKDFLRKKRKGYYKNILLKYKDISTLFLYLFKTTQEESDISLLFSGVMQRNDEARVCYGASPVRLVSYEDWHLKLIKMFNLDDILYDKYKMQTKGNPHGIIHNQKWFGSKIYLNGAKFKIFLQRILTLNVETKVDQLNLKMIFLQYSLSCLMATRHHADSLSFEEYSRREKIVCIQEKGKNLYAGKRIIPLTNLGVELADIYLRLKEEYRLNRFSPSLIVEDKNGILEEKLMRKGNISKWFISQITEDNREDIEEILKYTQHIPQNFGRHIFTSVVLQSSTLTASYLDAFLGHFKMGNEDQGIYSYFDNQKYMQGIRIQIEEIEKIYIPKGWRNMW